MLYEIGILTCESKSVPIVNASLYIHLCIFRAAMANRCSQTYARVRMHTYTVTTAYASIVARTNTLKPNMVLNYQPSIYAYKLDCVTDTFFFGACIRIVIAKR